MTAAAAIAEPVATIPLHLRSVDMSTLHAEGNEDVGFLLNSWQRSWSLSEQNARVKDRYVSRDFDELVRQGLLKEPDTVFLIGCDRQHPRYILSWVCYTPGRVLRVHYAYTRPQFDDLAIRRRGLFAILMGAVMRDATSLVYTMRPQARSHPNSNRKTGLEESLLDAATRRGVTVQYQPVEEFLGRSR